MFLIDDITYRQNGQNDLAFHWNTIGELDLIKGTWTIFATVRFEYSWIPFVHWYQWYDWYQ